MTGTPLLSVQGLSVVFSGRRGEKTAVRDASFSVEAGEILGVVGESGSGKSATALAILGLLPRGVGRITAGSVAFKGTDISKASEDELSRLRGAQISFVPQEPMTALNPTMTIGRHLSLIQGKQHLRRSEERAKSKAQLASMGFSDPQRILSSYPFELSGGQRQRALIAAAFLQTPSLLIADEPTTALDVTVQAEILKLLVTRARDERTAVLLITHNLGLVWNYCDSVIVMQNGAIVESGRAKATLTAPTHKYTKNLLGALPGSVPPRTPLIVAQEASP